MITNSDKSASNNANNVMSHSEPFLAVHVLQHPDSQSFFQCFAFCLNEQSEELRFVLQQKIHRIGDCSLVLPASRSKYKKTGKRRGLVRTAGYMQQLWIMDFRHIIDLWSDSNPKNRGTLFARITCASRTPSNITL
jgi:hypothetical protein